MTGPPAETRLHNSATPLRRVRHAPQRPEPSVKPRGLWYGIGDAWLEWCRSEMPAWIRAHTYALTLRPGARLLVLDTPGAIMDFHDEYSSDERWSGVDWKRVSAQYDGIEIAPYQWSLRLDHDVFWYYGWDCASGCIWRPRAIASVREVPMAVAADVGA